MYSPRVASTLDSGWGVSSLIQSAVSYTVRRRVSEEALHVIHGVQPQAAIRGAHSKLFYWCLGQGRRSNRDGSSGTGCRRARAGGRDRGGQRGRGGGGSSGKGADVVTR